MPFYIRKSVSAGPFRFNLSKSGVGLSVGVKGLRVGTGPRGHYVHAGRGGVYYRSSIGRVGERPRSGPNPHGAQVGWSPVHFVENSGVQMVQIESADVLEMADSRFQTILEDLNNRARQPRMSLVFGAIPFCLGFLVLANGYLAGGWLILSSFLAAGFGAYVDAFRRSVVVYYNLEDTAHEAYLGLVQAFEGLAVCAGKWNVSANGAVLDPAAWKRNAGASQLLRRSPTALTFARPAVLKSNLTPPSLATGSQRLYFLPDGVLIASNGRFGVVAYDNLRVDAEPSRFIETESVPRDAQIVDYTWRFVNKGGGPDRRFNNNRRIPICLYEAMHLSSASGLNVLFQFSKPGRVESFDAAARRLAEMLAPSTA